MWQRWGQRREALRKERTATFHGILTGRYEVEFAEYGRVVIHFTDGERAEFLSAIIQAAGDWLGRPPTTFMSSDLEDLVCGRCPSRYYARNDHESSSM